MNYSRRSFIQGIFGASVTLATGCSGTTSMSSGTGPASVIPGTGLGTVIGGVTARGTVDAAQFGGGSLNVLSVLQFGSPVSEGGFQTQVSQEAPHILLLVDGSGRVRGLALSRPGVPLRFDATSTAVALVVMSPGIYSANPQETEAAITLLNGLGPFQTMVSALASFLPTMDLGSVLAQPEVQTAFEAVMVAFLDVQAVSPRTEEEKLNGDGKLVVQRDPNTDASTIKYGFSNQGWRYVSMLRETVDPANQRLLTVPALDGSPLPGQTNIVSGATALSLGNLFTNTVGNPGSASDVVDLSGGPISEVLYYVKGIGNPFHAENEALPSRINEAQFAPGRADVADTLTMVYYILLPFLEPFMGGLKKTPALAQLAEDLASSVDVVTHTSNVIAAKIASFGDLKGLTGALIDVVQPLFLIAAQRLAANFAAAVLAVEQAQAAAVASAAVAAAEASAATLALGEASAAAVAAGGAAAAAESAGAAAATAALSAAAVPELTASAIIIGATATATLVFLTALAAVATANNCLKAGRDIIKTPRTNIIRVSIPGKFLKRLGTAEELKVVALSPIGTLLLNRSDGTYLEALGQDPVKLDERKSTGFLNALEQCWYLAEGSSSAVFRYPDGNTFTVASVDGGPVQSVVALSGKGHIYGTYQTSQGNSEMFSYTTDDTVKSIGAFAKLGYVPSIVGTGDRILYGNGFQRSIVGGPYAGLNENRQVKGSFGGQWEEFSLREGGADPPFISRYVDANDSDEVLIYSQSHTFAPGFTLAEFLAPLPEPPGGRDTVKIIVDGPSTGRFTVIQSTFLTQNNVSDAPTPVALNKEGEVVGLLGTTPTLWNRQGAGQDIRGLFPAGADTSGTWKPLFMRGRYIVLSRATSGPEELFLFHRGPA